MTDDLATPSEEALVRDHANWTADSRLVAELFDASPVPMVITSIKGDAVLAVNPRTSEVFGAPGANAVGRPVTDYYADPADREAFVTSLAAHGRADDVRLRMRRPDGTFIWVLAAARRVSWKGEPAILTAFSDITRQVIAEQALATGRQRLAAQSSALTSLTRLYAEGTEAFDQRLSVILREAAETLEVERLSLWRFDDSCREIHCVSLFRRTSASFESGMSIHREQCPPYFEALETERVIDANDARRDPRTRGFTDGYLVPNGIGAMLDVPLRQRHGTLGVLCAEHVGEARAWTLDEQNFALSVANLIAIAVADDERREAVRRLADSEARANTIVDTAHDAFIGIDESGRIVRWNAQAAAIFGWAPSEVVGRPLAETIIPPRFRGQHLEGMRRFHASGEAPVVNRRLELAALHRSGREFPIEITITSPMKEESGVFFGAFLRDISDRKERDDLLRGAKESAELSRDRLDRELASAGQMQQLILPLTLPDHPGVRFVAYYRTSRHAGGDYYDVMPLGPHRFALLVADVSGHGASAAIVMAMIRSIFHTYDGPPDDPPQVLHHINRHFQYLWSTAMFATSVAAVLDVERGTLRLSSAGHPPPLLVRGGQVTTLPIANAPLLLWDELGFVPCREERLRPGDRVVFYTDGITDRRAPDESRFEDERLRQALAAGSALPAADMVDHLIRELEAFAQGAEPDDDQTVLAIEIQ